MWKFEQTREKKTDLNVYIWKIVLDDVIHNVAVPLLKLNTN